VARKARSPSKALAPRYATKPHRLALNLRCMIDPVLDSANDRESMWLCMRCVCARTPQAQSTEALTKDAGWSKGQPVPYLALCTLFEQLAETSGRLDMQVLLASLCIPAGRALMLTSYSTLIPLQELLRKFFASVVLLTPEDLEACIYLATGQVCTWRTCQVSAPPHATCCGLKHVALDPSHKQVAPSYENVELGIGDALVRPQRREGKPFERYMFGSCAEIQP
jgi:hypothetical protein